MRLTEKEKGTNKQQQKLKLEHLKGYNYRYRDNF